MPHSTLKSIGKYPGNWYKIAQTVAFAADFTCAFCGFVMMTGCHAWGKDSKFYTVHHINLNKSDCCFENLIYLCTSCHSKVHKELNRRSRGNNGSNNTD